MVAQPVALALAGIEADDPQVDLLRSLVTGAGGEAAPDWPAQKRRNSDDQLGYSYGEIVPWINLGLELELPTDPVSVEA